MPLTAHRLEFTLQAVTPVELNEHQGAAIRGALFHALRGDERGPWGGFCAQKHLPSCAQCAVVEQCPVATLAATLDPDSDRGRDVPRPYVIDPPLDAVTRLQPGTSLTFGLTLFADAVRLFPYVILALKALELTGLGKPVAEAGWRRGAVRLAEAFATNPLTGARRPVLRPGDATVHVPDVPITQEQVEAVAARLPADRLRVEFLTPTRLVGDQHLTHTPTFETLFHRLAVRIDALAERFAGVIPDEAERFRLVGLAREVRLAADRTRWVHLESYSTRQRRATPIGGLVGAAEFEGDLAPFRAWLVWGQFTHVGKNAVKGDGWMRVGRRKLSPRTPSPVSGRGDEIGGHVAGQ